MIPEVGKQYFGYLPVAMENYEEPYILVYSHKFESEYNGKTYWVFDAYLRNKVFIGVLTLDDPIVDTLKEITSVVDLVDVHKHQIENPEKNIILGGRYFSYLTNSVYVIYHISKSKRDDSEYGSIAAQIIDIKTGTTSIGEMSIDFLKNNTEIYMPTRHGHIPKDPK
ncbi:hypothetical protein TROLL_117 [Bacillus phage Troll]|uniref:Uncharacterized protein n=6 Tax=Caudoviricetes TaxID=2731619 RepID=A0A7U3TTC7_9CAUD|nr:hypothetical protein TROLL_117 [Bacillus phage Troll]YP_009055875.1 hypothetical protein LD11_gp110 [Bacillus phage Riley]YP_009206469.1 hypothetical protein AVV02_gp114 [Bacillus phage AvesoBmore]ASZ75844.1 hypothetical protein TAFFO16_111 [Bacillus phage Taffo16]QPY77348.1 hypothetical protein ANTHOS_111 [Bacillus phage Anthos]AGT13399.1 hypothetical protein TROLL_117 [Bacillus phage Troll]AIF71986.1 hypothetical protein [Bacillus phage Riley]ALA13453.1 hypothetical protein AVESOBMORE_1